VRLAEARIGAARTLGRVAILEAAHRELLQDSPEGKQLAEAIAFNPKEPRTAIVRMITDPTNKDLGTNYAYTLQAGNWNFLSPTDKVMRLATWGLTHALTDQEGMRDTMRALRDPALPAQERLAAQRKLDTMMRVYSGKVADFGDVLSFMQFGGGPLLDWYEKATSDEQAGKSITIGDIAGEVSKAAGAPALALRAYANANPESDWASAFRDKSREVVVPDANLRESFGRVMARRLLGVAWRTLPLETIDTPQGKSYGTIDSYFQRLTKELEVSTGTEAKTIEAMQTKASQLAANGKQEEAAALQAKVDARMELRAMLFGLPADPRTGMPAVEGEVDRAKRELYDVLDRTRPAPRQRTDK
jgi:transposase InsO family protein